MSRTVLSVALFRLAGAIDSAAIVFAAGVVLIQVWHWMTTGAWPDASITALTGADTAELPWLWRELLGIHSSVVALFCGLFTGQAIGSLAGWAEKE